MQLAYKCAFLFEGNIKSDSKFKLLTIIEQQQAFQADLPFDPSPATGGTTC